jgi:hypothetical protein
MIREMKNANIHTNTTHTYVCKKRKRQFFFALNIKEIDEEVEQWSCCFVCLFYKSFVIAINQIKDGKLTTTLFKDTHTHCLRIALLFKRNRVTYLGMFAPHHCEKRNKMVTYIHCYTTKREEKKKLFFFCFSRSINL